MAKKPSGIPTNALPPKPAAPTGRMAELMKQTADNKASAARAKVTRPKAPAAPERVAPKVQPHQDAGSVFSRAIGAVKSTFGVDRVEKALDSATPKPKRNTRGW